MTPAVTPPPPPYPTTPKRRRVWPWLAAVGAILAFCVAGSAIAALTHRDAAPAPASTTPTSRATTPAAGKPQPVRFGDGTWKVTTEAGAGNVPPGTYRVVKPVAAEDTCFWETSKTSDGGVPIAADNVTGGRPEVTLKAGTWFKSQFCGTWEAVK